MGPDFTMTPMPQNKSSGNLSHEVLTKSVVTYPLLSSIQQGSILNGKTLNLVAHGSDLTGKLAGVVAGDAGGDDGSADTTGTAEVHLAANVDVRDCNGCQ